MTRLLFILTLFGCTLIRIVAFAGQEPQFTQYMFLKLSYNPAYAGVNTDSMLNVNAAYRDQWVGLTGSPKTLLFCTDTYLKKIHGGIGFKVLDDKLGNFHLTRIGADYSFHNPVGATGLLCIGIETELVRMDVTNNWLAADGTTITAPNSISTHFNMAIGAYYRTTKGYIGLSTTQLLPVEYYSFQSFSYSATRHYYLTAGRIFLLSSRINIIPSMLMKSDAAVTTFDVNTTVYWNNFIWAGASYRLQDAFAFIAGLSVKMSPSSLIKIGYAYDLGISDLKAYHSNTHEFYLGCSIKLPK